MPFEDDFLSRIAAAFGLPARAFDQPGNLTTATEAYERQAKFERRLEDDRRYWEARMQSVYARIMFSIMIDSTIGGIIGYDPQRLLTDQRSPWQRAIDAYFASDSDYFRTVARDMLSPLVPIDTVKTDRTWPSGGFYAVGSGDADVIGDRQTSTFRNEAVGWSQAVASPLEDLETFYAKVDSDWGVTEMRVLANAMQDDAVLRIILDVEASEPIPGRFDFEEELAKVRRASRSYRKPIDPEVTSGDRRDKSYLKHDPSKQHRRRRRRK